MSRPIFKRGDRVVCTNNHEHNDPRVNNMLIEGQIYVVRSRMPGIELICVEGPRCQRRGPAGWDRHPYDTFWPSTRFRAAGRQPEAFRKPCSAQAKK